MSFFEISGTIPHGVSFQNVLEVKTEIIRSQNMKIIRIMAGSFVFMLGILGAGFSVLCILYPVGCKMADDGDPFGAPPTLYENVAVLFAYLFFLTIGSWLLFARRWKKETASTRR
jgi:hypothetical protein